VPPTKVSDSACPQTESLERREFDSERQSLLMSLLYTQEHSLTSPQIQCEFTSTSSSPSPS